MTIDDKSMQQRKRERVRAVEELLLSGYCAKEITDLLNGTMHRAAYGTIRNDISLVYKMWSQDVDKREAFEGKARYMASLRQMRRKVMQGFTVIGSDGRERRVGRDYKLAHNIDKEIARMSGVRLASDEQRLHLDIELARGFMDKIMRIVFEAVPERDRQEAIMQKIADLAGVDVSAANLDT